MSNPLALKTPVPQSNHVLLVATVISVAVHLLLIGLLNVSAPKPGKLQKAIDVTVVKAPGKVAPESAQFMAAENQISQGKTTGEPAPEQQIPSPPPSEVQAAAKQEKPKPKPEPKPVEKTPPKPEEPIKPAIKKTAEKTQPKPAPKLITQQKAAKKVSDSAKPVSRTHTELRKHHISAETLQQQIRQVGSDVQPKHESAEQNSSLSQNQVSAYKSASAQYLYNFDNKIENYGNKFVPEALKNLELSLSVEVGINPDGSIHHMRIASSSQNQALDEAALSIVKRCEPFSPLPAALLEGLKEPKVFVFTRRWTFSDKSETNDQ